MPAVDFPHPDELLEHLAVMLLHCATPLSTRDAYEGLAEAFDLTRELLRRTNANGDNEWQLLVRGAYKTLKDRGYAPPPPPFGKWRLNEAGRAYAAKVEKTAR